MPNINAKVKASVTAICGGKAATSAHIKTADAIFSSVGKVYHIDETPVVASDRPLVARIFAVCYCRDDAAKPTTSVGNAMPATASGTIPPACRHAATHLPLRRGANGRVNVPLKK